MTEQTSYTATDSGGYRDAQHAEVRRMSRVDWKDEHFSVDGTLIQAWASHKSFQPKAGVRP